MKDRGRTRSQPWRVVLLATLHDGGPSLEVGRFDVGHVCALQVVDPRRSWRGLRKAANVGGSDVVLPPIYLFRLNLVLLHVCLPGWASNP